MRRRESRFRRERARNGTSADGQAVAIGAGVVLAVAAVAAICIVGAPAIGVNVAAYVGVQLWRGQPIDGRMLAAAAIGGAVAGGLAGTTFGATALAGGAARATQFLAVDGGAASGVEKMTLNAIDHKALGDGVPPKPSKTKGMANSVGQ